MGIKIENVFYTYQKKASNSTLALNDVSFNIKDNDFVAIVGETGSGKSTLAQCLNALIIPDQGQIVVNDVVVSYKNRKSKQMRGLRKRVGLVFQFPEYQLFEESVEKDVAFGIQVSHSHRRSNRTWKPNVKRVKAIVDGSPKHVYACTRCLRSGKVTRAV